MKSGEEGPEGAGSRGVHAMPGISDGEPLGQASARITEPSMS